LLRGGIKGGVDPRQKKYYETYDSRY